MLCVESTAKMLFFGNLYNWIVDIVYGGIKYLENLYSFFPPRMILLTSH